MKAEPLDVQSARKLQARTPIVVLDSTSGEVVENLKLLRYGGFYRLGPCHTFAVKKSDGKFALRTDHELGLTPGSERASYPIDGSAIDLTEPSFMLPDSAPATV